MGVWSLIELGGQLFIGDHRPVWEAAAINFVPLWFIAAYVWVVALVPLTASLHERGRELTLVIMGIIIVAADLVRFDVGIAAAALVNTAVV